MRQLNFIQRELERFSDFDLFWKLYPRRVSKRFAWKAWKIMPPQDRKAAIEGIWKVSGTELRFIPYPATYLHARRWEDETVVRETGIQDISVGRGPQVGFGSCKSCGERFTTHSQACNHECAATAKNQIEGNGKER